MNALRDALAADPRVAYAILFGSEARESAHAGSDLDVALELTRGKGRTLSVSRFTSVLARRARQMCAKFRSARENVRRIHHLDGAALTPAVRRWPPARRPHAGLPSWCCTRAASRVPEPVRRSWCHPIRTCARSATVRGSDRGRCATIRGAARTPRASTGDDRDGKRRPPQTVEAQRTDGRGDLARVVKQRLGSLVTGGRRRRSCSSIERPGRRTEESRRAEVTVRFASADCRNGMRRVMAPLASRPPGVHVDVA
jgi:hypothetical protein